MAKKKRHGTERSDERIPTKNASREWGGGGGGRKTVLQYEKCQSEGVEGLPLSFISLL